MFPPALTAADEVHNFEAIVGLNVGGFPPRAREHFVVVLDGHAIGRNAQVREQRPRGEARG